jgi:TetR/AcrR family transcriptional repressor of nem operon
MRYAPDHKPRTRARILGAAAKRFRERGVRGAGVDEVMRAAGLTAGGFYAHFESKQALLREVLAHSLRLTRENLLAGLDEVRGVPWVREVVRRYLSRRHRDDVSEGCVLPTLTAEIARQDPESRRAFEGHVRDLIEELGSKIPASPGLDPKDRALAITALFAGGLMLSRAVPDRDLSDRILLACRRLALAELDDSNPQQPNPTFEEEKP